MWTATATWTPSSPTGIKANRVWLNQGGLQGGTAGDVQRQRPEAWGVPPALT